jgi:ATP synthase protein I
VEPAWKSYGRYSTVGLELVLSMVLGWAAGRWVDKFVGGHGYATAAGTLLGLYAGFRALWKAAKLMEREAEREDEARARKLRGEDDDV